MNYLDLYSSYPDRTIAGVWESQVKEANDTPGLADALTRCGEEVFARFVTCYAELKARPRRLDGHCSVSLHARAS